MCRLATYQYEALHSLILDYVVSCDLRLQMHADIRSGTGWQCSGKTSSSSASGRSRPERGEMREAWCSMACSSDYEQHLTISRGLVPVVGRFVNLADRRSVSSCVRAKLLIIKNERCTWFMTEVACA